MNRLALILLLCGGCSTISDISHWGEQDAFRAQVAREEADRKKNDEERAKRYMIEQEAARVATEKQREEDRQKRQEEFKSAELAAAMSSNTAVSSSSPAVDREEKSAEICFYRYALRAFSTFTKKQIKMSRDYGTYDRARTAQVGWKASEAEGRLEDALAEMKEANLKPLSCNTKEMRHKVYCMDNGDDDPKCP